MRFILSAIILCLHCMTCQLFAVEHVSSKKINKIINSNNEFVRPSWLYKSKYFGVKCRDSIVHFQPSEEDYQEVCNAWWDRDQTIIIPNQKNSEYNFLLINMRTEQAIPVKHVGYQYNMPILSFDSSFRHYLINTEGGSTWKVPKNQRAVYKTWQPYDYVIGGYNGKNGTILINISRNNYMEAVRIS